MKKEVSKSFEQELSDKICKDVAEIINDQWTRSLNESLAFHTDETVRKVNAITSTYDKSIETLTQSYYTLRLILTFISVITISSILASAYFGIKQDKKIDIISHKLEDLGVPVVDRSGQIKFFPKDFKGDTTKKR
jgi:hypothetical protein